MESTTLSSLAWELTFQTKATMGWIYFGPEEILPSRECFLPDFPLNVFFFIPTGTHPDPDLATLIGLPPESSRNPAMITNDLSSVNIRRFIILANEFSVNIRWFIISPIEASKHTLTERAEGREWNDGQKHRSLCISQNTAHNHHHHHCARKT